METARTAVARLLREWSGGRREALDELFPLLYRELRRLAASQLRREVHRRSLQTTELLNEAYLKLVPQHGIQVETTAEFFAVAARSMRTLLVDRARTRNAAKRSGGRRVEFVPELQAFSLPPGVDVLAIDEALTRLSALDPRQARIVELRFFAGLTIEEVSRLLRLAPATINREWTHARAWLYAELKGVAP